jgi:diguanylate cyclase (GGDEF)-like protein/PAS domain S-box-containing protein
VPKQGLGNGVGLSEVIHVMLYLAAALQVIAAVVALLLVPESGMRRSWMLICAGLVLMAARCVYISVVHATLPEAAAALAVSAFMLAGIVGIRSVFKSLRVAEHHIEEEMERENAFLDQAGVAVVVLDRRGLISSMNPAACAIVGGEPGEDVGQDWFELFVEPGSRELVRQGFASLMESPDNNDEYVEYVVVDRYGDRHTLVWHRRVLRGEDGGATGSRSAGIDITERAEIERDLAFKSRLLDQTTDSVLVYHYDGTIVYANDTACRYRGRTRDQLVGANIRDLLPAPDRSAFELDLETLTGGSCAVFEMESSDEDGCVRVLESHACPIDQEGERLIVDVARDITERRAAEEAMRRMVFSDPLTDLPNRVLLYDRAKLAVSRARRGGTGLAVLFADLDNLKRVNDSLGHRAGDELLRLVGARLAETFRGEDTVARIGGDEFVVVAQVVDREAAETVAHRLVELLAEPFEVAGELVESSVSVGVAVFPDDGEQFERLVACADAAMYRAKDAGRGRYRMAAGDCDELEDRSPALSG